MPDMHDIASQLTAVEEKLHFLHQTITACRGAPLNCEALAGLAHIVADLVHSVQEVRRDVDGVRGRDTLLAPGCNPECGPLLAAEVGDMDDDAQEQRRHGAG